ncbi:MAG TPA: triose-phosphate isomerase [Actinobacteria bacterium]|nr:triose-phosphate isomerase [Actinomycetes bacterium]HEX21460.1 triose-phosphate isomerase [Actinomycetota bacterium]
MRKPIIAGNWKMNMTASHAVFFLQFLEEELRYIGEDVEVVVCPPFTDLRSAATVIEADNFNIGLGAQDMYWEEKGAFTGEISPLMLNDLRVSYVIIGHSERRNFFGETNVTVNKKVKAAIAHHLKPIICVGESLDEHNRGETLDIAQTQLVEGLKGVAIKKADDLVVAYEPIWAIGTGRNATPAEANDAARHIRTVLGSIFSSDLAGKIRIQYGGSVNPDNISAIMKESDIDGALVGGASLDVADFTRIIKYNK